METNMRRLKKTIMIMVAAILLFSFGNLQAQTTSTGTVTGPNGQTVNRAITGRGTGNVNATVTGPNGQTATRSVTGRGTGNVSATATGPRGAKVTRSRIRQ
jgi:phosphoribosylformylglycinamidine (FGAM) synthase PurS component